MFRAILRTDGEEVPDCIDKAGVNGYLTDEGICGFHQAGSGYE